MQVRRATKDDIPGIGRLLGEVHDVHAQGRPDLFRAGQRKYDDDELAAVLDDPAYTVFVADDDGKVVGHAFCMDEPHALRHGWQDVNTLYIDDICVEKAARGRHVGTALYEHVLAYARERGYYDVTLHVWECNPGARAFYESLGMKPYMVGMEQVL